MIIRRPFWEQLIEKAWKQRTIIWLMGVRRVGKTSLCQSLPDIEYFDCELPLVRQLLENPVAFLTSKKGKRLVFDEIHRLDNPSEILKIAADYYPDIFIIATGSSMLGASAKFKDTLTGRKREVWLIPLLLSEIGDFGNENISHRLLFGGLPSFFASESFPEDAFKEWSDAYWAKDIQDMFSVGKRSSFHKFTELLLVQSGGQFEASAFAAPCKVSRQTIANYLAILEVTFVVHIIRPYSTRKANEIIMAPKVYGFDTGFVCYAKGWYELRKEDLGILWEHCVLNELHAHLQTHTIHYWRDKQGHEIDFVLRNRGSKELTLIECKFNSSSLSRDRNTDTVLKTNIVSFRQHYPHGKNYVVTSDAIEPFERHYDGTTVTVLNVYDLIEKLRI